MTKTLKKSMTKKVKGGNGILTYALNDYKTDTQLDNNYLTTRQMYNDQSMLNPRFLGGKKSKTKKNTKTSKKVKKMKKSKRGTRK